jgi:hypothetical protein
MREFQLSRGRRNRCDHPLTKTVSQSVEGDVARTHEAKSRL